jgi:hypothetical protein
MSDYAKLYRNLLQFLQRKKDPITRKHMREWNAKRRRRLAEIEEPLVNRANSDHNDSDDDGEDKRQEIVVERVDSDEEERERKKVRSRNESKVCYICEQPYSDKRDQRHFRSQQHLHFASMKSLYCPHKCKTHGKRLAALYAPPAANDTLPSKELAESEKAKNGAQICTKCGAKRTVFAVSADRQLPKRMEDIELFVDE